MTHPDQLALLHRDPDECFDTAVEEVLSWATPVLHFRRTATKRHRDRRPPDHRRRQVVIWHISANRDEDVWDNPFDFDIGRNQNQHVAFGGGGPHFCLGANLARMELRLILP